VPPSSIGLRSILHPENLVRARSRYRIRTVNHIFAISIVADSEATDVGFSVPVAQELKNRSEKNSSDNSLVVVDVVRKCLVSIGRG
jgi:hypothetical protein